MIEILATFGTLALLGGGSAAAAYWLWARRLHSAPLPELGSVVRLRGPAGTYRTRLEGIEPRGWRIGAPLQRDRHVPLRVGESMILEAPSAQGAYLFRTYVLERNAAGHTLLVSPPVHDRPIERRRHPRISRVAGQATTVDGLPAELVDLSAGGARVCTGASVSPGDCVRVRLHGQEVDSWVLDHAPGGNGSPFPWFIRVSFVEDQRSLASRA